VTDCKGIKIQTSSLRIIQFLILVKNQVKTKPFPYLYITIRFLGHEGHVDGEEVVRVPADREFHAARLVGGVDHRKVPVQRVLAAIIGVLPVTVSHHRRSYTRPGEGIN